MHTIIMNIDSLLSAIHIKCFTKIQSEFIVYVSYKINKLTICIDDKSYDESSIHLIDPLLLHNRLATAYLYTGDGSRCIDTNECLSKTIGEIESDRFNGLVLHFSL